jgi:hypothetical protein
MCSYFLIRKIPSKASTMLLIDISNELSFISLVFDIFSFLMHIKYLDLDFIKFQ